MKTLSCDYSRSQHRVHLSIPLSVKSASFKWDVVPRLHWIGLWRSEETEKNNNKYFGKNKNDRIQQTIVISLQCLWNIWQLFIAERIPVPTAAVVRRVWTRSPLPSYIQFKFISISVHFRAYHFYCTVTFLRMVFAVVFCRFVSW